MRRTLLPLVLALGLLTACGQESTEAPTIVPGESAVTSPEPSSGTEVTTPEDAETDDAEPEVSGTPAPDAPTVCMGDPGDPAACTEGPLPPEGDDATGVS